MIEITGTRGTATVTKTGWGWVAELNGEFSDTCPTRREAILCAKAMVG
jgi:hypothetical protein